MVGGWRGKGGGMGVSWRFNGFFFGEIGGVLGGIWGGGWLWRVEVWRIGEVGGRVDRRSKLSKVFLR